MALPLFTVVTFVHSRSSLCDPWLLGWWFSDTSIGIGSWLGHGWKGTDKVLHIVATEFQDLVMKVPLPFCRETLGGYARRQLERTCPALVSDSVVGGHFSTAVVLEKNRPWLGRFEGEVMVSLHLRHIPEMFAEELCPVIDWHDHFSILGAHKLCCVDVSRGLYYVSDLLQAADKSAAKSLLEKAKEPVRSEFSVPKEEEE